MSNHLINLSKNPSAVFQIQISSNDQVENLRSDFIQSVVEKHPFGNLVSSQNQLEANRVKIESEIPLSFSVYYPKLFPQETIKLLYVELDPGVDDGAALLQILAALSRKAGKKVELVGVAPSVGNAVLSQTEKNTLQFLELTNFKNVKAYPGAVAPLAIENNQTAINEMEKAINATHFYGHDGESDVGGWPKIAMQMQNTPGYKYAADQISAASAEAPLTLVSTSALTELAKTLNELELRDSQAGLPAGSFAKNINAISIMGGCLSRSAGCNAPFDVPDNQKYSEANFYFDAPAAQKVFAICEKYGIPILLAPLDLTQQPGLLWTKDQVKMLEQIDNPVSRQMARVTNVVPYLDQPCFPNGTYPMHDLQAVTNFLFYNLYKVIRSAVSIGDKGQMMIDVNVPDTRKNVYLFQMGLEEQKNYYPTVLAEYANFQLSHKARHSTIDKTIAIFSGILSVSIGWAVLTFWTLKKCCIKRVELEGVLQV